MLHKEQAFKRLCNMSFSFYCKQFLKVVEPETNFDWNWHLDIFCKTCEDVYYGKLQNIDIQVPPRTLKSIIFNVLFPTWIWTKEPAYKILSASSSYELANKYNRQRREVISSEAYQFFWPIQLKDDANTMRMFANTNNGFMRSVSSLGKVTGEGADCFSGETLITTNLGNISIKELHELFVVPPKAGNGGTRIKVLTYNHERSEYEWKRIVATRRKKNNKIVRTTFSNGSVITSTSDHKFYTMGRGYEPILIKPEEDRSFMCLLQKQKSKVGFVSRLLSLGKNFLRSISMFKL